MYNNQKPPLCSDYRSCSKRLRLHCFGFIVNIVTTTCVDVDSIMIWVPCIWLKACMYVCNLIIKSAGCGNTSIVPNKITCYVRTIEVVLNEDGWMVSDLPKSIFDLAALKKIPPTPTPVFSGNAQVLPPVLSRSKTPCWLSSKTFLSALFPRIPLMFGQRF